MALPLSAAAPRPPASAVRAGGRGASADAQPITTFFAELLAAPVPIDLRALAALTSSLALDVYCWLTYRLSGLSRPLTLSWPALALQFGSQTARPRDFRRRFVVALAAVLVVYPEARVRAGRDGLVLFPSPSHVPSRP